MTATLTTHPIFAIDRVPWRALRLLFLCGLLISASAAHGESDSPPAFPEDEPLVTHSDPWERYNRAMFRFNDRLVTYGFRPISRTYETVTPKPLRRGLANAFDNLKYPVRLTGALLQGKGSRAKKETGKFLVNTVAGVGGLMRVSDKIPALAQIPEEDIGQTLAVWGVPSGPYLILPIFGPSTPRDFVGFAGDFTLNPVNWDIVNLGNREWINPDYQNPVYAAEILSLLPRWVNGYEMIKEASLDPYVATREAYLAHRKAESER